MKGLEDLYLTQQRQQYLPTIMAVPFPRAVYTQAPYGAPFTDMDTAMTQEERLRATRLYHIPAVSKSALQNARDLELAQRERLRATRLYHAPAGYKSTFNDVDASGMTPTERLIATRLFRTPTKTKFSSCNCTENSSDDDFSDYIKGALIKDQRLRSTTLMLVNPSTKCTFQDTDILSSNYTKSSSAGETVIANKVPNFSSLPYRENAPYGSFTTSE
jgi:hypothetical protein